MKMSKYLQGYIYLMKHILKATRENIVVAIAFIYE